MSKIPQGEWNAIAARYAQGESISKIAQTYGCTPPAIHYILKRSKQRPTGNFEQPPRPAPAPAPQFSVQSPPEPEIARPIPPRFENHNGERPAILDRQVMSRHTVEPPPRDQETAAPNLRLEPSTSRALQSGNVRDASRASAFTAGLDHELHGRAEAAIAAFRSSFDAALAEESPVVRQRLRQAASDLMRVAARTTIVLDRLNANAEHSSGQVESQFRR